MKYCVGFLLLLQLLSCGFQERENEDILLKYSDQKTRDIYSFAEPDSATVKHLSLNLTIDFNQSEIRGVAAYNIVNKSAKHIRFDVKNLIVDKVLITDPTNKNKLVAVDAPIKNGNEFGDYIKVPIDQFTNTVHIVYRTTSDSEALQWLMPEQTVGKTHPFLYTQGFSILTRSWIPIQDSPGIKMTYDAQIRIPKDMQAVMSAKALKRSDDYAPYVFLQNNPVAPYLITLAVGRFDFQRTSATTGVYAEPPMLLKAVSAFRSADSMLTIAESIAGPYQWERCDVLVMPPSFPYGGMENPNVIFISPSAINGTQSQIGLIAHEIAHAWAGNQASFATWEDVWISEGFATYLEYRIKEKLESEKVVAQERTIAYVKLEMLSETMDTSLSKLKIDLNNQHPDVGLTSFTYDKGEAFIHWIENEIGRQKTDEFLKQYFNDNKFKTLTSEGFLAYLNQSDLNLRMVDVAKWIYSPELPEADLTSNKNPFKAVDDYFSQQSQKDAETNNPIGFNTLETIYFLDQLGDKATKNELQLLDHQFEFSSSNNPEILFRWYRLAILNDYEEIKDDIVLFLSQTGRSKYILPLYCAMKSISGVYDYEAIYLSNKPFYHFSSQRAIEACLFPTQMEPDA